MAVINSTSTIKIIECSRKTREDTYDLLEITREMSDMALTVLAYASNEYAGIYPRYPAKITVDAGHLRTDEIKILGIAELVSDRGINELIKKATCLAEQYPKITAEVVPLKRVTAKKSKHIRK